MQDMHTIIYTMLSCLINAVYFHRIYVYFNNNIYNSLFLIKTLGMAVQLCSPSVLEEFGPVLPAL